ncbi:hypothetical protein V496_08499 [Pseudogymnoascus sp. VKM F-4515 (FW-2607)]|nr:hypothetical protein V496_08499 [Pseudogymnoascus sp. VKM F-4515 (FW-2607)]
MHIQNNQRSRAAAGMEDQLRRYGVICVSVKVVVRSEAEPRVVPWLALGACPRTNSGIGITLLWNIWERASAQPEFADNPSPVLSIADIFPQRLRRFRVQTKALQKNSLHRTYFT